MNYKFQFKRFNKTTQVEPDVSRRMRSVVDTLPDGDYEWILREKPTWDVDKMRRFLHGPVLKFLVEQFKALGHVISKDEAKHWVKERFGPTKEVKLGAGSTLTVPKSTSEWDFETYKGVLKNLNEWCANYMNCELPTAEEIE